MCFLSDIDKEEDHDIDIVSFYCVFTVHRVVDYFNMANP